MPILLAQRSERLLPYAPVFRVRRVLGRADQRQPPPGRAPGVQCLQLRTAQGCLLEGVLHSGLGVSRTVDTDSDTTLVEGEVVDDGHRARGMSDDLQGDRAEHHGPEASSALGTQSHGLRPVGLGEECDRRRAIELGRGHLQLGVGLLGDRGGLSHDPGIRHGTRLGGAHMDDAQRAAVQ